MNYLSAVAVTNTDTADKYWKQKHVVTRGNFILILTRKNVVN